jgi:glycosyltransferase involved in cell wall biosynthesis
LVGPPDPGFSRLTSLGAARGKTVRHVSAPTPHEVASLLRQSVALVFPSHYEGFGLPVLEAMASGTAVITSNVSSLPEVAGSAAILVGPNDVAGMTDAMERLLQDDKFRGTYVIKGLARAAQFTWKKSGQLLSDAIETVLH